MKINVDGRILEEEEAGISVLDHGLLLGDGVFETLRTYNGRAFKLKDHFERLCAGTEEIGLKLPFTQDKLKEQVEQSIKANGFRESRIRVTVTRGVGPQGLSFEGCVPSFFIIVSELFEKDLSAGVDTVTFDGLRVMPHVKSLSYMPSVMAKAYACKKNAFEALFKDSGFIREGSFSSLFVVEDKRLITPKSRCLKGVTAGFVKEIAEELELTASYEDITVERLLGCDEVFLTFTSQGIVPVKKVDDKEFNVGQVTKELMVEYKKATDGYGGD